MGWNLKCKIQIIDPPLYSLKRGGKKYVQPNGFDKKNADNPFSWG